MRSSVTVLTVLVLAVVALPGSAMAKQEPRPNLADSALGNPPSTLARGASLAGTATIKNKGTRRAGKSKTGFFLSRDARRSKDDLALGSVKTKALRPGKKVAVAGAFKLPATATPGPYRLLVCADSPRKVRESNERDNCRASRSALKVAPLTGDTAGSQTGADGNGPNGNGDGNGTGTGDTGSGSNGDTTTGSGSNGADNNGNGSNGNGSNGNGSNGNGGDGNGSNGNGGQNNPPANAAPTAADQVANAQEEVDLPLALSGTDADDCDLTFNVAQPAHGTVTAPSNNSCTQGSPNVDTAGVTYTGAFGYHGPDSFTYTVSDGHHTSAPATVSIDVAALNDAPRITAPDSITAASTGGPGSWFTFSGPNAISVQDGDAAPTDHLLVTVAATHGTVTLGSTTDLTFTVGLGSGNTTTTFHGNQAAIGGALSNLHYSPDVGYSGPAGVTITVNDQGASGPGGPRETQKTVLATVVAPPVNSVPGTQTFTEDTVRTFSAANGNAITVADPNVTNVTVQITATHGTLHAGALTPGATLSANASPATINTLLNGLTYTPDQDYNGPAQIEIVTGDAGATGAGTLTDDDTIPLSITPVNDPPHNFVPATQHRGVPSTAAEEAVTFGPDFNNAIGLSDPDAQSSASFLTVTFTSTTGSITLGHTDDVIVLGNGTNNVSVTGTLTALNNAFDGLVYRPSSRIAGNTVTAFTMTSNDLANSGGGGAMTDTDSVAVAYEL